MNQYVEIAIAVGIVACIKAVVLALLASKPGSDAGPKRDSQKP